MRTALVSLAHAVRGRQTQRSVVLVYHKVAPVPPADDPWTVSIATFARHLEILTAEGFRDVMLEELESATDEPEGLTVLIAFDDGYRSAVELALPVLRAARRRAAFFLVAGAFGGMSEWERPFGLRPSRLVDTSDALHLVREGMSIGSHSMTHTDLRAADEPSIEREVVGSKAALEHALGVTVRSFAVPYGRDDGRLDRHLVRAGYARKFTNPLAASRTTALKAYPVTGIVQGESLRAFRHHLSGADEIVHAYHRVRAMLERKS